MRRRRPSFLPLTAALALLAPLAPRASTPGLASPIPWQEPGPTARLFLQLPFEGPATTAPGELRGAVRVLYANALVVAAGPRAAVEVDQESALFVATARAGLGDTLEAFLHVPVIVDGGGVFDGFIDAVEDAFQSHNFQRAGRPRGLSRFRLAGPAGEIGRDGDGAGLADVSAGLKWRLHAGAGAVPSAAGRLAVKAPTGRRTIGSGHADGAVGLLLAWELERTAVHVALDLVAPGGGPAGTGLRARPAGSAQLGVAWRAAGPLSLHGQLSAHQSVLHDTGVGQLDKPIYDLLFGLGYAFSRGLEVQLAGAENFASPRRGADATLVLSVVAR